MVFVAVSLPKLARSDMAYFKATLEGNTHQNIFPAVFWDYLAEKIDSISLHA